MAGCQQEHCSPSLEVDRLRAIFPKILESLQSGGCSPDCSVEFMEMIPNEVALAMAKMKRERDKWKAECKRQWKHLSQAGHNARAIQNIRWGYEGDCGAARLANLIEEDCDRGMMSPENDEMTRRQK